ncbi:hypothetical protein [Amycolatopsis sp. NPDC004625]|uniref:hypothetical protein n=1 Tax=Amycolatopsis sp. NPDC004625 TaxID=3154670 RepID=UPI0033AE5DE4
MTGEEHDDGRCGHDPAGSWDLPEDRRPACSRCDALRTEVEKLRLCLNRIAAANTWPAADLVDRIIARVRLAR